MKENLKRLSGYARAFLRNILYSVRRAYTKYASIGVLCHFFTRVLLVRLVNPRVIYHHLGIWPFSPISYNQFKVWGKLGPPVLALSKTQPRSNNSSPVSWQPCGKLLPEERMGYVVEVQKGFALKNGLILAQKGHTIIGASPYRSSRRSRFWSKLEKWGPLTDRSWRTKLALRHYSGTVMVLSNSFGSRFYGHYLYEVLGRLALVEDQIDAYPIYIPNQMPYQKRYLTMLGLDDKQIISVDQEMPAGFTADRLVIPCFRRMEDYLIDPKITDYLRRKLLPYANRTLSPGERIYISRRKARRRHILNEQELLPILAEYGFSVVYLEDYSVDKQISVLKFAKIIISPHGTGLDNLLYCEPNTRVLEIFPGTNVNMKSGFIIATSLDLEYYYLIGAEVGPKNTLAIHNDITVAPDIFRKEIELLVR